MPQAHSRQEGERRFQEMLNTYLANDVTFRQLARMYGVSDSYLVQAVKQRYGCTPGQLRRKHGWVTETLPPWEAWNIVQSYKPGETSLDDLAKQTGHPPGRVADALHAAGIEVVHKQSVPPSRHTEVARRYQAGESAVDLAEVFECSEKTIRMVLDKQGVSRRPIQVAQRMAWDKGKGMAKVVLPSDVAQEVVDCYRNGDSAVSLAKRFGCGELVIRRTLVEAGVQIRSQEEALRLVNKSRRKSISDV